MISANVWAQSKSEYIYTHTYRDNVTSNLFRDNLYFSEWHFSPAERNVRALYASPESYTRERKIFEVSSTPEYSFQSVRIAHVDVASRTRKSLPEMKGREARAREKKNRSDDILDDEREREWTRSDGKIFRSVVVCNSQWAGGCARESGQREFPSTQSIESAPADLLRP